MQNSFKAMLDQFAKMPTTPDWLMNLIWAHKNGKIDAVQTAALEALGSSFTDAPRNRQYCELSKVLFRYFSLTQSEKSYEVFRRIYGGPTFRYLTALRIDILTDVGCTTRNMVEARIFFEKVSC